MSPRFVWTFFVLSLLSLATFVLTLSRDWTREWRGHQQEYARRLLAMTKDPSDQAEIRRRLGEFNQIVVAGGWRVERCTTCHLAVDDPRFKDAPQPLRSHPDVAPHAFDKFGCTVCHGGVGRATEARGAHEGMVVREGRLLPSNKVEYMEERVNPLWRKEFVQASCGSCHFRQGLKQARALALGKSLFRAKGCMGCHKIGGVGGKIGPDLTFVGGERNDPEWYMAHFESPGEVSPGSVMPSYKNLSASWRRALTVFMLSLRSVPSALLPGLPLEQKEVRALVEPPVSHGHWEAPDNADALKNPLTATPAVLAEGRKLYSTYCANCHGDRGRGDGKSASGMEPKPADFTSGHSAVHAAGSLFWKIQHGRGLMPGWGGTFSDRQIWLLVIYVQNLGHKGMGGMMRPGEPEGGHSGRGMH